jgi:hypothetical protein
MHPGNALFPITTSSIPGGHNNSLQGNLKFSPKFCKTGHLVLITYGPTLWTEWSRWAGISEGGHGWNVCRGRLSVAIALAPNTLGV